MTPFETLEQLYNQAVTIADSGVTPKYSQVLTTNLDVLLDKIDKNKSLVAALLTS